MNTTTQYVSSASGDIISFTAENQKGGLVGIDSDVTTLKWGIKDNLTMSCFRIFVLYPDETINYEIPITDIGTGGSYSENYQNGQRRSLSFTLYNYDGKYTPNINTFWAGTRLRFDMGLKVSDEVIYWFKKGVFIINNITPSMTDSLRTVSISAADKFSLFEGATGTLSSTYEVPIGTDIQTIVYDILKTDVGNGFPLDPQDLIFHSSFAGKKTQAKISKSAGENLGALLLEIATQLSAEVFYNSQGNLIYVPINEVTEDNDKPLIYSFETSKGDITQLDFALDYNSIINRIIVIGNSESNGTYISDKKNDDPASPLCGKRIGYRTGSTINDSNIYSQVLADERADYELRQVLILKSTTSASVVFNPFLEVNNIIAISDEFFNLTYERFLLQSVSCSLDFSNQMSISFSNLNNLPFVVS